MQKKQQNYFNMVQAVCDVFATRAGWQIYGLLDQSLQRIKKLCNDINKIAAQQHQNASNGHTTTKKQARTSLEDHLYTISMRLKAWAQSGDNAIVLNQVKYSRSSMFLMPLQSLLTHARTIAETCEQNIDPLCTYLIFKADVDVLLAGIEKLSHLNGHRDAVIDSRMEKTSRLKESFAELRKELKVLDTLVEAYITDSELLSVYFNARRIHDVKGGSVAIAKEKQAA